jgi:hypothetical protein
MAKAKKPNPYATWQQYPKEDARRGGCKVSWNYYRKREDAETCAKAAKHNAQISLREGYDFGYQSPGSIREVPAGTTIGEAYFKDPIQDVGGMFEVCLP